MLFRLGELVEGFEIDAEEIKTGVMRRSCAFVCSVNQTGVEWTARNWTFYVRACIIRTTKMELPRKELTLLNARVYLGFLRKSSSNGCNAIAVACSKTGYNMLAQLEIDELFWDREETNL